MTKYKRVMIIKRIFLYLGVVFLMLFVFTPFLWMISSSFKTSFELYGASVTYFPHKPTLASYIDLFKNTSFFLWFINSSIITVVSTFFCILIASIAAYSLTRYKYPGRESFTILILLTYMVPPIVLAIPLYFLVISWHLADTRLALIITYSGSTLPYSIWLLRAFFQSIPIDFEEAAMIDGASKWRVLVSIVFPLALPGLIATSIFAVSNAFGEYLYAMLFISSDVKKTLPVGLADFITERVDRWDLVFAGSVLASLPLLILFVYTQKFLLEAWGAGGIKG